MVGNRFKGIAAGLVVAGMLAAPASAFAKGNRYRNVNRRAAVVQCEAGERVVTERDSVNRRDRVVARCEEDERSKTKTALMIGGGAATGAGVGAVVDGTRGALIGAAIGGGAASIYEASKRR